MIVMTGEHKIRELTAPQGGGTSPADQSAASGAPRWLRPRNWSKFQHYRKRNPPWVKLHRAFLDDYEISKLPLECQGFLTKLWLIASEYPDGAFDASAARIAHRTRIPEEAVEPLLQPLLDAKLLEECEPGIDAERKASAPAVCEPPHAASRKGTQDSWCSLRQGDTAYECCDAEVAALKRAFPRADLALQFDKMRAWLQQHATPEVKDFPRFISNWLSRDGEATSAASAGVGLGRDPVLIKLDQDLKNATRPPDEVRELARRLKARS